MEIIVKREDIPGGIKFTTKDCEYPRHFASTIRQALLLDGVDEDMVDEIFGRSRDKVACVEFDGHIQVESNDLETAVLQELRAQGVALGIMPIGKPEDEQPSEKVIEWELPAEILTNDCETLSRNSKSEWYKKMVYEMKSQPLFGDLVFTQTGDRVALVDRQKGLIIEPYSENIYVISPMNVCNKFEDMKPSNGCEFYEDLRTAMEAVKWNTLGEK